MIIGITKSQAIATLSALSSYYNGEANTSLHRAIKSNDTEQITYWQERRRKIASVCDTLNKAIAESEK